MNYYIDTEFLEGTQKENFPISLFRKNTPPTIDLISIGIVAEDGREYYAISKDFNLKEAWNIFQLDDDYDVNGDLVKNIKKVYWIRENVLKPIWKDYLENRQSMYEKTYHHELTSEFSYKTMKTIIKWIGKTNKQIAEEIKEFTKQYYRYYSLDGEKRFTEGSIGFGLNSPEDKNIKNYGFKYFYEPTSPKFYAYYADYDWVAFCWLFGKMMDLPSGFPMYCVDLKQEFDNEICLGEVKGLKLNLNLKNHPNYPKQENEHNALADARWNKKLHEFLNDL